MLEMIRIALVFLLISFMRLKKAEQLPEEVKWFMTLLIMILLQFGCINILQKLLNLIIVYIMN